MSKLFKHWVFLIVLLIGLLVGSACYYFAQPAIEQIRLARASTSWSAVDAKVLSALVDSIYSGSSGSRTNYHRPKVRFEYAFDNKLYESDQIYFGNTRFTDRRGKNNAYKVLEPYSNYPTVTAFVNPSEPSQAVLEPGLTWRSFEALVNVALGFAIAAVIIGFAFWVDSPFRKEEQRSQLSSEALIG